MKTRFLFSTIVVLFSLVIYGQKRPKINKVFSVSQTSAQFSHEGGSKVFIVKSNSPQALIDIFEKHGFIWGGRWYHYDTMHFEYRSEIISGCIDKRQ